MGRRNTRRRPVDLAGPSLAGPSLDGAIDGAAGTASAHVLSSADHASTWEMVEGAFFAQGVEDDLAAIREYATMPAEAIFDIEKHLDRKKRLLWMGSAVGVLGILALATVGIVRAAGHKPATVASIAVSSGSGAGGPVAEALGASRKASMPSLPSGLGEAPGTSAAGAPAREPVPMQAEPAVPGAVPPVPSPAAAPTVTAAATPEAVAAKTNSATDNPAVAVEKDKPVLAQAAPAKATPPAANPAPPAATPAPGAPTGNAAPTVAAPAAAAVTPGALAANVAPALAAPAAAGPVPVPAKAAAPAAAAAAATAVAAASPNAGVAPANVQTADEAALCREGLQKKQSKAIVGSCASGVEKDASLAPPLLKWAKAEFERGRTSVAANMARKIIQISPVNPDLADAYVIVGTAEQESSRASAAKVAYRRYLDLAPRGYYANDVRSALKSL